MAWQGLGDFLERGRSRLDPPRGRERLPETGDGDFLQDHEIMGIRAAAVLIPVIDRPGGATALLTRRPDTMLKHAGQVAFPGGKIDPVDADAADAALREAEEEVGLPRESVELIGRGSPYVTGSAFRVTPLVGLVPPDFIPVPHELEVAAVFETPLEFLMNPANHTEQRAMWQGRERRYFEMPHGGFRIWGVTAGIIRELYLLLYGRD